MGLFPRGAAFFPPSSALVPLHGLHVFFGGVWLIVMMVQVIVFGLAARVKINILRLGLFWHFPRYCLDRDLLGRLSARAKRMNGQNKIRTHETWSYAIGYILALVLTGVAFAMSAMTLAIDFGLTLLQMIVHFRFFLHISLGRSSRDDLQLILFSTLIVVLMVSGTIVILMNLNERMM